MSSSGHAGNHGVLYLSVEDNLNAFCIFKVSIVENQGLYRELTGESIGNGLNDPLNGAVNISFFCTCWITGR